MALSMSEHMASTRDRLRYERVTRRVRASMGAIPVADTTAALLVWEPRRVVPVYAIPQEDLLVDLWPAPSREVHDLPALLGPEHFDLHTCPGEPLTVHRDDTERVASAFRPDDEDLAGHVLLDFAAFDWVEEVEPVAGHPHDPFNRIDIRNSDRNVVVSLDGTVLADSRRPVGLFETGLPIRWYLPREDVRMDLLTGSDTRSVCAYKGRASYFSFREAADAGADIAWTYEDPFREAERIRGLVCFFAERTDEVVDGTSTGRPVTFWTR